MSDRDPDGEGAVPAPEDASAPRALVAASAPRRSPRGPLATHVERAIERFMARVSEPFSRGPAREDPTALVRTGGAVARWVSFPRGVRVATAATSTGAMALAVAGMLALAGHGLLGATAALAAALGLSAAWGPVAVRLASRLHRLVFLGRRHRVSELRALPDRRAVAVRGVVVARRTSASALDGRQAVWSLVRLRRGALLPTSFFHEAAFDFLLDDGTDEPIWIEVAGGMLVNPFPADERVQFRSTTLLELDHPFLTRLRLDEREVLGAEITIAPGDVVDVVGRLSRRLDPTAPSESGRDQPQRRALRSGARIPVMIRRGLTSDPDLVRVRRSVPKGSPSTTPGEPPVRKF